MSQETALRSERQLEESRRALARVDSDKETSRQDTDSARGLAARLNARISELTLSEQCAHADAEAARRELQRLCLQIQSAPSGPRRSQTLEEMDGGSLSAENPSPAGAGPGVGSAAPPAPVATAGGGGLADGFGARDAMPAGREAALNRQVEESETAVAVMQVRAVPVEQVCLKVAIALIGAHHISVDKTAFS